MRKAVSVILILMLTMIFAGCGDNAKEISEKKYQEIMSGMGIQGAESAVDGVILSQSFRVKTSFGNEYGGEDDIFAAQCGEKKEHYYAAYALDADETAAKEKRAAYIETLVSAGYELISTDDISGDFYSKDNYGVMVKETTGPVHWDEASEGQYGMYVSFY